MSVEIVMGMKAVKVVDYSDYRQIPQLYARNHLSEYFVLTTVTAIDYAPKKICLLNLKWV